MLGSQMSELVAAFVLSLGLEMWHTRRKGWRRLRDIKGFGHAVELVVCGADSSVKECFS